jgi:hypothetical protein
MDTLLQVIAGGVVGGLIGGAVGHYLAMFMIRKGYW